MKHQLLKGGRGYRFRIQILAFIILLTAMLSLQRAGEAYGQSTRYEAESINKGGDAAVATTYSGYSGSGYITGMQGEWSNIGFDRGDGPSTSQLVIRYANGTGAAVTNLAFYIGSGKVQDLVFPSTGSWTTWSTITVNFNMPSGYLSLIIKSKAIVSTSVNIDYIDYGTAAPVVATPTFSPGAGTYTSTQSVTISTSTSGATIYYTTDGSTPTTSSAVYSAAVSVSTSKTLKALATKSGSTNSAIGSAAYTINTAAPTVATPTFSPAAGTYTSTQSVTISTSTSGATIYYTTDGSTPTTSSAVYSGAVSVSTSKTLKALATKSGSTNSAIGSAAYTINTTTTPTVATPTFSPGAGTYTSAQTVTISTATSGASIRYTTDGSTPTSSSTLYSAPISVSASKTVKAIGILSGYNNSAVASAAYTINTSTPPPTNGQPGVIREIWTAIPGTAVTALTSNANYPNSPTSSTVITSFDAQEYGDSYGQRIRGYLAPTVTGSYQFWIAADDQAELWLSTNSNPANKVKIASVTGWTNPYQYSKEGSQASSSITLTAGNYYYIEALHKEDNGGDHVTVAWQVPGGSQAIITSTNLVTAPPVPLPLPGAFTQTAPASGATGVSLTPTFSWASSSDAASYTLVVSTSSSYSSPVINQSGLTATSFTPGGGLSGTTTYYWKVTAVNATGTKVATNAGLSFTTLTPPAPGAFNQTAPASNATSISRNPTFTWGAATNASSYSIVVSTSSAYTSPIINVSNLTSTSYSPSVQLASSTKYYWKVTAVNSTSSTNATNAGISFTTGATTGTYYYVATNGVDQVGRGGSGNPFATPSFAATQVSANQNNTIYINAGTYNLTQPIILPTGVNLEGAGVSQVTLKSSGVALPNGVSGTEQDFPLWAEGSLIQAVAPIYSGDNPRYGSPSQMIAAIDGNQTISGFTIDGNGKSLKAGVWVLNRNNVTMFNVNFKDLKQTGAVFSRGDMWYYEALPEGKWMKNVKVYNCTFTNSGSNPGQQEGCLKIGGIDGCEIYNITINDTNGQGIKFAHVGHHRNTKIHDCTIRVPESHPEWGEFMAMELWNLSYGNEVYNIDYNTWLSYVNFVGLYNTTPTGTDNLYVHNVKCVDLDGSSSKEAIEIAAPSITVANSYFQDKGFYMAVWNEGKRNITIRKNIFANVVRTPSFGFANSAGVFVPDGTTNLKIYNNVFDRMGNGIEISNSSAVDVKNNVFLNTEGADVQGSVTTFSNNLKYHTNPQKADFITGTSGSNNILGNPGFQNSGARWDTYYKPSSSTSLVVDKGVNVGLPFSGNAPDIGRWEFGLANREIAVASEEVSLDGDVISTYPNPTTGIIRITAKPDTKIVGVQLMTTQGRTLLSKSASELKGGEIDLSAYPNDIYIISVRHERGLITKKVVLVK